MCRVVNLTPTPEKVPSKSPTLVGLIYKTCNKKKHNTYVFQNDKTIRYFGK